MQKDAGNRWKIRVTRLMRNISGCLVNWANPNRTRQIFVS
jgi:hypothetical protein